MRSSFLCREVSKFGDTCVRINECTYVGTNDASGSQVAIIRCGAVQQPLREISSRTTSSLVERDTLIAQYLMPSTQNVAMLPDPLVFPHLCSFDTPRICTNVLQRTVHQRAITRYGALQHSAYAHYARKFMLARACARRVRCCARSIYAPVARVSSKVASSCLTGLGMCRIALRVRKHHLTLFVDAHTCIPLQSARLHTHPHTDQCTPPHPVHEKLACLQSVIPEHEFIRITCIYILPIRRCHKTHLRKLYSAGSPGFLAFHHV